MVEKEQETNEAQVMDETEVQPTEAEAVASERPRRARRLASGPGDTMDDRMEESEGPRKLSVSAGARVMGHLTIRELEMMPKMEEISRMEEIVVVGTTNIQPEVIGAIAGVAAQAVEGVASLGTTSLRRTLSERLGSGERRARGVEVEVGTREAILDINFRVVYGYSIPVVVATVRKNVAGQLLTLCGLVAKEINVRVVGMEFPDRMSGKVE